MQRSSLVQAIGKIAKIAYKLDLPDHMRIHDVVSIQQLEPVPKGEDPYGRHYETRQGLVEAADEERPVYEIERLLAMKVDQRTRRRKSFVQ